MLEGLSYSDGVLYRNGKPSGFKDNCGYLRVCINRKKYLVHRLIYKLHNPEFNLSSDSVIDHINRDRTDNHIENLRAVTKAVNNRNRSECRGVSYCKQTDKWKATLDGIWLGRYATEQEALDVIAKQRASNQPA